VLAYRLVAERGQAQESQPSARPIGLNIKQEKLGSNRLISDEQRA